MPPFLLEHRSFPTNPLLQHPPLLTSGVIKLDIWALKMSWTFFIITISDQKKREKSWMLSIISCVYSKINLELHSEHVFVSLFSFIRIFFVAQFAQRFLFTSLPSHRPLVAPRGTISTFCYRYTAHISINSCLNISASLPFSHQGPSPTVELNITVILYFLLLKLTS